MTTSNNVLPKKFTTPTPNSSQQLSLLSAPLIERIFKMSKPELVGQMWEFAPQINQILKQNSSFDLARAELNSYLSKIHLQNQNATVRKWARNCIQNLQSIIDPQNEADANFSSFRILYHIAHSKQWALNEINIGFLQEFIYLFKGIQKGILPSSNGHELENENEILERRNNHLDGYSQSMDVHISRYISGLNQDVIAQREENRKKIIQAFGATDSDWNEYKWHLKNKITSKNLEILKQLVNLEPSEIEGLNTAIKLNVNFSISPYYLSLFNFQKIGEDDRAIRAQVIPTKYRCIFEDKARKNGADLDFMGEKSTSPVENVTRRYSKIVILKPILECFQYCDYCQRNWEYSDSKTSLQSMKNSLDWIKQNKNISAILVTGGDPLVLKNSYLDNLLFALSNFSHIKQIRIGTRALVTMPMRFDDELIKIFNSHHKWGEREICIMTHVEHPSEITPQTQTAIRKIKSVGMNIYNQQVFTYFNSRRFESAYLRQILKVNGIDPYYTFNTKGKESQKNHRVPISRIMQERWEEARILPGLERTDEPVFNVPKMGKSHLRSGERDLLSINADGTRTYRFYPWDYKDEFSSPYIYKDVSIPDYLNRLFMDGENLRPYRSIWYY